MADTKISAESAASALNGAELFICVQGGANKKATGTQIQTFVAQLPVYTSADGTAGSAGVSIAIQGGDGNDTGNGAIVALNGGDSGAGATGDGGGIFLSGGTAQSTDGAGGGLSFAGGNGSGSGQNGGLTFQVGTGGDIDGVITFGATVPCPVVIDPASTFFPGQATSTTEGAFWYDISAHAFKGRLNGSTQTFGAGASPGGSGGDIQINDGASGFAAGRVNDPGSGSIIVSANMISPAGASSGDHGVNWVIEAGAGNGTGSGGNLTFHGGASGDSGPTSSGGLIFSTKTPAVTDSDAGNLTFQGGDGTGTGHGANMTFYAGASEGDTGAAGTLGLNAGTPNGGTPGVINLGLDVPSAVIVGNASTFFPGQTASAVEGALWYDFSAHLLKFYDGTNVKTVLTV